jgi:hypothetical protein
MRAPAGPSRRGAFLLNVTDTKTFLLTKLSAPTDSNTAIDTARQRT